MRLPAAAQPTLTLLARTGEGVVNCVVVRAITGAGVLVATISFVRSHRVVITKINWLHLEQVEVEIEEGNVGGCVSKVIHNTCIVDAVVVHWKLEQEEKM